MEVKDTEVADAEPREAEVKDTEVAGAEPREAETEVADAEPREAEDTEVAGAEPREAETEVAGAGLREAKAEEIAAGAVDARDGILGQASAGQNRHVVVKATKEVEAESRVGVKQVKAGATEKEGNTSGDLAPETDASTVGGQEYSDTPPGAENTSARSALPEVEQVENSCFKPVAAPAADVAAAAATEKSACRVAAADAVEVAASERVEFIINMRVEYEVGWKPVWAVVPPGDSAFPPLPSRSVQGRGHVKALQWSELKWTSETVSTVDEKRKENIKRSWRHCWVRGKVQSIVPRSEQGGNILPQLVDRLDICFDLGSVPKHQSLYWKRRAIYPVVEKRKRFKKKARWKVKIEKKERRPKLSRSFAVQEIKAEKRCRKMGEAAEKLWKEQQVQVFLYSWKQKVTKRLKSACAAAAFNRLRKRLRIYYRSYGEKESICEYMEQYKQTYVNSERWMRTVDCRVFGDRTVASVLKTGEWGKIKGPREGVYGEWVDMNMYGKYIGGVL